MNNKFIYRKVYLKTFFKKKKKKKKIFIYFQFLFCFLKFSKINLFLIKNNISKLNIDLEFKFMLKNKYKALMNVIVFLPILMLKIKKKKILKKNRVYFFNQTFYNIYSFKKNLIFWKFLIIISKNLLKKIIIGIKIFFYIHKIIFFSLYISKSNIFFYHSFFSLKNFRMQLGTDINILIMNILLGKNFSIFSIKKKKQKKVISLRIIAQILNEQETIVVFDNKKKIKNFIKTKKIYHYYLKNQKKIDKLELIKFFFFLPLFILKKKKKDTPNLIFVFFLFELFITNKKPLSEIFEIFFQFIRHFYSFKNRICCFQLILFEKIKKKKKLFFFTGTYDHKKFLSFPLDKISLIFFPTIFSSLLKFELIIKLTNLTIFRKFFFHKIKKSIKFVDLFLYFLFLCKINFEIFSLFENLFIFF